MKFREYTLSTGLIIHAGKDSASNDELVRQANKKDLLLHTKAPGSPFVNIGQDANKQEIQEAAIICAKHSQEWRDKKTDVKVSLFKRSDMKKNILMKEGTWNVKKYLEEITAKKTDIKKFEEQ